MREISRTKADLLRMIDSVARIKHLVRQSKDYVLVRCANDLKYLLLSALPKPYLHRLLHPSAALVLVLPSPSFFLIAPPSFLPSLLPSSYRSSFVVRYFPQASRVTSQSRMRSSRQTREREPPHKNEKNENLRPPLLSSLQLL